MKHHGIDSQKLSDDQFEVIRSDAGDGGWSIHWIHDEDEEGMPSEILVSGTASWLPNLNHGYGDWNRPDASDFADAIEKLFRRHGKTG